MKQEQLYDAVIIGAGLTGLTTALQLARKGLSVAIVEKAQRTGGQIETKQQNGYTFETGPNTGVLSNYEVIDLFNQLPDCCAEIARPEAKKRLIYKKGKLHALPAGLIGGIKTPLFSWNDKFRILFEPFRAKGTNPDESVAGIARRRLGKSFVNYAVDPFISGIYAGNPELLVTRYALPKLYNLEQNYGGFIKGAIKKAKEPKTDKEKQVTKEVFSVRGGLEELIHSIERELRTTYKNQVTFFLSAENTQVFTMQPLWICNFTQNGEMKRIHSKSVVSTIGSYELPHLLPFVSPDLMTPIERLRYAGVIQVSVGINHGNKYHVNAFGALMPSVEKREVLGVLFPTACFSQRTTEDKTLYSIFIGGIKRMDLFDYSDRELEGLVRKELHAVVGLPLDYPFELFNISRHEKAIPQYEADSGERFDAIEKIEKNYPGLFVAGNICGGIGMPDRIRQGYTNAGRIAQYIKNIAVV